MPEFQFWRCDVDAAIGCRERTARIDRIGHQRRRDPDQEGNAKGGTLQERFPVWRLEERTGEEQKVTRREEQVRQAKIDREPDQEADQHGQNKPLPRSPIKKSWREITRRRADHHGRRHRVARLGRIDHQIERGKAEQSGQRKRGRFTRPEQAKQRKTGDGDSPMRKAKSPESPPETAPAQIRSPAGIA